MTAEETDRHFIDIDLFSVEELISLMSDEDQHVVQAVRGAKDAICRATEDAITAIRSGGSLIYIGAGTSGRPGIVDASGMHPTFNLLPGVFRAIIAGGDEALITAVEGAEDDEKAGVRSVATVTGKDMLLGITASSTTPFVISALKEGKRRGARCWLLTCSTREHDFLDGVIRVFVGPEVIAGSTRPKSGTATKMVLNMISTATMIKLGGVYKGYMVDVVPSSRKLKHHAMRIIQQVTGCTNKQAEEVLKKADGNAKTAIVMYLKNLSRDDARRLLEKSDGSLRKALESDLR